MEYKAVPSIDKLQVFICADSAKASHATLASQKTNAENTINLDSSVFIKDGNLILLDRYCFINSTVGSSQSLDVNAIDKPHEIPSGTQTVVYPTRKLKGYTKIGLKVGKELSSVKAFTNSSLAARNRKVATPITVNFQGIYNHEDLTFDELVIPASQSDEWIKLFILYPFGKLRLLSGTIYDYQEIAELKDGALKIQWTFEGNEIKTYQVN